MHMIRYDSFTEATIVPFCWSKAEAPGSATGGADAEDTRRRWGIQCEEPLRRLPETAPATDVRLCRGQSHYEWVVPVTGRRMGRCRPRVRPTCWVMLQHPSRRLRLSSAGTRRQGRPSAPQGRHPALQPCGGRTRACDSSSSIPISPGASRARASLRCGCRT